MYPKYDLTLLTCTADQSVGMALCEHFMQAQTLWPHLRLQWIVVDDGDVPARLTLGQQHVRRDREPGCTGAQSLCRNLMAGLPLVEAQAVAFIEHDDFYRQDYLENLATHASRKICGASTRYYYNLANRRYKLVDDGAPALCQMMLHQSQIPLLTDIVGHMLRMNWWGIDRALWFAHAEVDRTFIPSSAVVGIKGLPGRPGIGYGHRPNAGWDQDDDNLSVLSSLVGPGYATIYADIMREDSLRDITGRKA